MFLFTNASVGTRETGAPAGGGRPAGAATAMGNGAVIEAIREGAQTTGIGFDYLLATAQRESGLDPSAKAATSSASGLFQFIEQTWLGVMKTAGARLGLAPYADAITARADGTYTVSDPAARQAILDLRRDPRVASALAGALTQRNREALGQALGREPTSGDLYAAHVLGAKGAASLIASAQTSPARAAALDLPEAAAANKNLFYDRGGRARGSAELYALLATSTAGGRPAVAAASSLPEMTTAYASFDEGLRSLFQTDRRQGAVSTGVAKLWQDRAAAAGTRAAPTYFPRSDASEDTARQADAAAPIAEPVQGAPIVVPLPPRRPAALSAPLALSGSASASAARPRSAAPLDFSAYALRNGP